MDIEEATGLRRAPVCGSKCGAVMHAEGAVIRGLAGEGEGGQVGGAVWWPQGDVFVAAGDAEEVGLGVVVGAGVSCAGAHPEIHALQGQVGDRGWGGGVCSQGSELAGKRGLGKVEVLLGTNLQRRQLLTNFMHWPCATTAANVRLQETQQD